MGNRTTLYEQHLASSAKIVDFSGWDMPLHYGSQLEEHHKVRQDAGMFDVSHMGSVDVKGRDAKTFLRHLLANDVERLYPGKALYTCMLNEQGGVIDDLIVYYVAPDYYRVIVNAGTRQKDLAWLKKQAQNHDVTITERTDLAMIALQGPQARAKALTVFKNPQQQEKINALKPFHCLECEGWLIARTGYTGEDGLEIILPTEKAADFWQRFIAAGIAPCGLGARDTLRLEAGLNLYGSDMDETTTPLESNLAWTVAFTPLERQFIGRTALEKQQQQGVKKQLVGLVLEERGVLRNHQKVIADQNGEGEITSGGFAPTLNCAIALARIPSNINGSYKVMVRDKLLPVRIVKPPFVRNGKKIF